VSNHFPITPPPELAQKCWDELRNQTQLLDSATGWDKAIALAYQAGADQELEACCEWIPEYCPWDADQLRAARRPKPSSLKEEALKALERMQDQYPHLGNTKTIRRALEALND